jgi:hypothetical protein
MKHPFPVHRSNTITRVNVEMARAAFPDLDTAEKIAEHFCGIGRPSHHEFAEPRHVLAAMRSAMPKKQPTKETI